MLPLFVIFRIEYHNIENKRNIQTRQLIYFINNDEQTRVLFTYIITLIYFIRLPIVNQNVCES